MTDAEGWMGVDIFYTENGLTGRWRYTSRRRWFGRARLVRQVEVDCDAHENLGNQIVVRSARVWRDARIEDEVFGPGDVPGASDVRPGGRRPRRFHPFRMLRGRGGAEGSRGQAEPRGGQPLLESSTHGGNA